MKQLFSLRVLTFKEGDAWIAQALEHDICVQAPDEDELKRRFELVFQAELRDSEERGDEMPLGALPPAPARFREIWMKLQEDCRIQRFSVNSHDIEMALCA